MELDIDLSDALDRKMLGKMKRGMPVQLKPKHLAGVSKNVKVGVSDDKLKKMMKAMRLGKGFRIALAPEETEMIEGVEFTQGGRISLKKIGKAFKSVGKDIKKGLNKSGEELKKFPKYYRKNIREYTSPIAKVLIEEGLPLLGETLVTEGMKAMDVPAPVAKLAGKATRAGLKKPSKMAYKKSGLGMQMEGMGMQMPNIELMGRRSRMGNSMEDGGMYPPAGRRRPITTLPFEAPMVGSGKMKMPSMRKLHKAFSKDGQVIGAIREETSKIPYIGGRIFSDKLIDPLNKAYQPNAMVDQMGPENNSRRGGMGLYAGLPMGRGMYV
jgi:hypothetical protein